MRISGAIIAGGKATRLGGSKPLVPFAGATLLDAVIGRVRSQVDHLALNLPADTTAFPNDLPVLVDTTPGVVGPLAGIVAALEWARSAGVQWLASFPGDTPFLPHDLVAQLQIAAQSDVPVFAHDGTRAHYLCALWPGACLESLRAGVTSQAWRSLYRVHEELGAASCVVKAPPNAFFNVNTPEDLAEAERLAAEQGGASAN